MLNTHTHTYIGLDVLLMMDTHIKIMMNLLTEPVKTGELKLNIQKLQNIFLDLLLIGGCGFGGSGGRRSMSRVDWLAHWLFLYGLSHEWEFFV